ncbi:MarR family winged helix-turn-helix transcriptional regulator [Actinocorallia sp. API 0066]|uniref:MarR family winged helix-turn-helix transcriptional regulator n=1 Tax=Actinocorallia sp. API 0066 TaxID=2896846 RepID=UPI001E3841D7|nr:MarR family winged helix-turn-helix transcriptional regulator [Actinocorallia sp. API 0066]MCD0453149.1 MarR family winged helix-turn-helix transcriptional regulator [Actinocorallia sp. API 0066]
MPDEIGLGVLLFVPYREMERRVFAALAEAGHELTPAQARLLARIADDGSRVTDLAESAQITKQTAGYLVDQLERAGYVERVLDPTDARARLVRFTARAEAARPVADAATAAVEAEWLAHLGPRRYTALRDALTRLRPITDPYLDS